MPARRSLGVGGLYALYRSLKVDEESSGKGKVKELNYIPAELIRGGIWVGIWGRTKPRI